MTHTPGPWTPVIAEGKRGGIGIWEVKSVPDLDFAHHSVVSEKAALSEADAHLIAAAPELLEALKAIIHANDRGVAIPSWPRLWSNARAAIAKAEER